MPSFEGGAPIPVTTGGSGRVEQRAAVPVAVVSGVAPQGGRARRVVVVTSGPVEGGAAHPVYDAGVNALYSDEPALPVYVVSGSFGPPPSPLLSGIAAYWRFDEASGDLIDVAGLNTLTQHGSPGTAAGVVSTARSFVSGSSQYFDLADNDALSGGDRDFHFAGWVFPTIFSSGNGKYVFSKADSAATREYWLVIITATNNAQFSVTANGSTIVSVTATSVNMSASNWYFVDCGHDSVNNQIFVRVNNGTKHTTAHTTGVFDSGSSFRMSGVLSATNFFFDGRIDELGRWNRLLTDAEITTLYNGGIGKSYPF